MSLLYKALNQASKLRETGTVRPDPAPSMRAATATVAPLAERLMAQGFSANSGQSRAMRIARLVLFGLVGISAVAIGLAFLLPADAPQQIAAPETIPAPAPSPPPAPTEVQAASEPIPAEAPPPAPGAQAAGTAPEPSIAEVAKSLAEALDAETAQLTPSAAPVIDAPAPAAPARIGATPAPAYSTPGQKHVRDGGLENFVEEQVAREALAGLGAPITIDRTAPVGAIGRNAPVEITNDTDIVRERYETAALMLERDQPEEAMNIYDQLLRNNPKDRLSLLGRAAALQKLGRNLMAVSAYEDVLAAFPGDEWAMVNLLGLISVQDPQRAVAQLERLQRLYPATAVLPAQIGMIQMARGNFEMAARSLEKALSLDQENAKYVFNLAVLYDKWGQPKTALRYYRQCLEMAQQNPDGQIPLETVRQRMAFLDVK